MAPNAIRICVPRTTLVRAQMGGEFRTRPDAKPDSRAEYLANLSHLLEAAPKMVFLDAYHAPSPEEEDVTVLGVAFLSLSSGQARLLACWAYAIAVRQGAREGRTPSEVLDGLQCLFVVEPRSDAHVKIEALPDADVEAAKDAPDLYREHGAEGGAIARTGKPWAQISAWRLYQGLAAADAAPSADEFAALETDVVHTHPVSLKGVFPFALPYTAEKSVECEGVLLNGFFGGHKPTPGGGADPHTCAGAIQEAVQVIREVVTQMGEKWNAEA